MIIAMLGNPSRPVKCPVCQKLQSCDFLGHSLRKVALTELYLVMPDSVTGTIFQGHGSVKIFHVKKLFSPD